MQEQEEKHVYSDKWPERWASSNKTWSKWQKDAEEGKFPRPIDLQKICGYCEEHGGVFAERAPDCDECTLSKKGVCHDNYSLTLDSPTFWLLIEELKKDKIDKPYVIRLINKIVDAIKEDDPSKVLASL